MDTPSVFTFTLDHFKIENPRSLRKDTDYVSFTLLVKSSAGVGTPKTITKSMGDLGDGTHKVGLTFSNVPIKPTDIVVLNYLIVNSGKKGSDIHAILESTATTLANKGVDAATAAAGAAVGGVIGSVIPIPGLGTLLGATAGGWLAGEVKGLLHANCDGPVAAEQNTFTYANMVAKTAHGTFTHTTRHPGTDSPRGCGANSKYDVTWFMQSH